MPQRSRPVQCQPRKAFSALIRCCAGQVRSCFVNGLAEGALLTCFVRVAVNTSPVRVSTFYGIEVQVEDLLGVRWDFSAHLNDHPKNSREAAPMKIETTAAQSPKNSQTFGQ